MTTDSHTADRTPQTAVDSGGGINAPMRAAARASTESNAAHTPRHVFWQGWRAEFVPPTTWADPWPSLRELALYAQHAPYAGETGPWHALGVAYFWLWALPNAFAARHWAWITERPSRFAVATVLYVATAHTSAGQAVLPWPTWLP